VESARISSEGFLDPEIVVGQFGVQPAMRIADFGCGAGHIGLIVAQKVGPEGKVIAIDILEDKLESIRARAKAIGLENLETVRANLEVLGSTGLPDASQDMVILANILFQSPKKADIIKEATRVTKAGGKVVVVEWKKGAGGFGPPDNYRTAEAEMIELFKAAGCAQGIPVSAGQFHYGLIFTK
jgi:ubiquinone/menaquinone biosynthesis C-methylase UbiE